MDITIDFAIVGSLNFTIMMKKLFFIVLLFSLTIKVIKAQKYAFDSVQPTTVTQSITNEKGQPYELIITLPIAYQAEKEYKILYYLDAWWLKDLVMGCYRINSLSTKTKANKIDDVILVGISAVGSEIEFNRQRNMDFTPSRYNLNIQISMGSESLNDLTTGGAEDFLEFFRSTIITAVESKYKVDANSRGILGHSLGGLLGFYSYINKSGLFSNYLLISPSIWWNNSEIFSDSAVITEQRKVNMFTALGTEEINMMKRPMDEIVKKITKEKNENLNFCYKLYENANHHSVLPQAIYDGFTFLYTNE